LGPFVRYIAERVFLLANLVGIAARHSEQTFAARLDRDDMLARRKYDTPSATTLSFRIASRITANACRLTSPSGAA